MSDFAASFGALDLHRLDRLIMIKPGLHRFDKLWAGKKNGYLFIENQLQSNTWDILFEGVGFSSRFNDRKTGLMAGSVS